MPALDDLGARLAPMVPPSAASAVAPKPDAPPAAEKPSQPGMIEKMIGGIGAGAEAARSKIAALDASTMKMSPPELKLPPKPEPKNTSPIDAWGSMAMVFAALASTRVRNHATTAMNAAAEALKSIKAQDKEAYDQAFKSWEVESKNALEVAHFQQDAYKTLLASVEHKENLAERMGDAQDRATEAKLRAVSSALQDPAMIKALDHGGIDEAVKLQEIRRKQTEEFELRKLQMKGAGSKAEQAFAMKAAVESPEWKAAKTLEDKLTVLADKGVDSTHILIALEKMKQTGEIAADKSKLAQEGLDLKKDAAAEKASEFDKTFGLKARETDLKEGGAKEKALEFKERMALAEKTEADRVKQADDKLAAAKEKLKAESDIKTRQIEEKAKEAFDKIALGRDVLAERAVNDKAKDELGKYKLGETHEEFAERQKLEKEKLGLKKDEDAERKAQFREKMDLELKKFDEKKAVDEAKAKVAQEKLANAEKAGATRHEPLTPDQIEDFAHKMVELKMPMATNRLVTLDKTWAAANARAFQIAKEQGKADFSEQWYPALLAQRKDAGSGQASKGIRYLSVANKHLEAMEAAVMSLPNDTDLKGLTKVFNFVSNQVNDSNLAAEQVDGQIVANEVAKAISGAGNLTGEERDKLNSMFDSARGKASILNIIHHARELLGGQAGGYVKQFSHYGNAADVTGMDQDAAKRFFIDPKTGDTDSAMVKWDQDRIAATLAGKPPPPLPGQEAPKPTEAAAPAAPQQPKFTPDQMSGKARMGSLNGKDVFLRGGKYVFEDGSPAQ